jgi:N-acetylmuramoyl-L-alanine amidase
MSATDKAPHTTIPARYHEVRQGEWVSKISAQYGITDWQRVWNHPNNSDLRQKREEPNVICPGDLLFIPERELRVENCPTDNRHCFTLRIGKKKLKLVLVDFEHKPRTGITCTLEIDNQLWGNTETDGQGELEFEIPERASAARLFVGEDRSESYEVGLGHLDPIDEVTGYQQRLSNLGYYSGEIDGIDGFVTKSAVRSFQDYENFMAGTEVLKVDGIMGPKTKARLELRHGY